MKRNASAKWTGTLRDGNGIMNTGSGAFSDLPYAFSTRFESEPGTNPEELVAAALAGCFSMALSAELGRADMTPESVETNATLTFEKGDAGWSTSTIHLDVVAAVPGADEAAFQDCVDKAKANCPISRLLDTEITASARLA